MKKWLSLMVAVLCTLTIAVGSASAKDEELLQDLVKLEKAYIPPLFFTSAMAVGPSVKSMNDYMAEWRAFSAKYYFYKPDFANWQTYFDQIEVAALAADAIVKSAVSTGNLSILPLAHEELEAARMVMLEMRPKNGFPHFITDKQTIFHGPMEHIVLSVKGKTPTEIDAALLLELDETLKEASKAWGIVVICPIDFELWGLTPLQITNYQNYVAIETAALTAFTEALESGDKLAIIQTGVALKPNFVESYKIFGNFAQYMPQ